MTAFSDFYPVLRILLGDNDAQQVYLYQDATLDSALKSVFRLGRSPQGFRLSDTNITPDVPDGNCFATIAYEAVMLMVVAEDGAQSYRTRAISVNTSGDRKRDLLQELRMKLYEVRDGGDGFASYQTFLTWLNSNSDIRSQMQVKTDAPFTEIDVSGGGPSARGFIV